MPLIFPSSGSDEGYIRGYREQVEFLNRELEQIVMTILANADTTPVIVIQADHGPDSNTGRQGYVQERMTILNALLLPGGGDENLSTPDAGQYVSAHLQSLIWRGLRALARPCLLF